MNTDKESSSPDAGEFAFIDERRKSMPEETKEKVKQQMDESDAGEKQRQEHSDTSNE